MPQDRHRILLFDCYNNRGSRDLSLNGLDDSSAKDRGIYKELHVFYQLLIPRYKELWSLYISR